MALPENPITRKEMYLAKIAGQEVQIPDAPITREEAYLDEIAKEGMGTKVIANPDDVAEDVLHKVEIDGEVYSLPSGGGGSNDYLDLNNLPQVNGVELKGNKSTSDLGIRFTDLPDKPILGTASAKNVPVSGDASSSQVVMGNDSRLSDSRPASDVSSWAKQSTKPTYTASEVGAIATTQKGVASGVAELDANGKVPSSQLPSYVDDVVEGYYDTVTDRFYTESTFENVIPPESGKSWVDVASNKSYRWTGSVYSRVDEGVQLGETSGSAYRGDRGKTAYDHSQTTGNPHGTTKSDVGLSNVPNVSTNDQEPTFTEATTRNNIASGEKLSVIFGKIQKFFNDLKTVAFSGSYNDLSNKPSIPSKTSDITNDSNFVSDANYVHTDNNFTTSEKTKLAGIASGAEANVQANWSQTNTSADDFIKNKPNLATVATSGSYADLTNTPTIPAAQVNSDWNASSGVAEILNKPSSYKPSSHLHGNIQNNGTLQTTDIAVANGDKLVVTDSSNSAKIARTSVAFDGTTTTQALSKKGTFETFSKFSGSYNDLSNKPTIPTSAGGISYDNTNSGLTATDVQGAVDELADSIHKGYGTTVDITRYNSTSNYYTCPSDGVVYVDNHDSATTTYCFVFSITRSTIIVKCIGNGNNSMIMTVPVLKGEKIYASGTSGAIAIFFPYT